MQLDLPYLWVIALNVLGWPMLQLGLAWIFTRLPLACFENAPRGFGWEMGICRRLLRVHLWKDRLPDAAGWFAGGFQKRSLQSVRRGYLERFLAETWRGELCHWCAIAMTPIFFLWNPLWADVLVLCYALLANLPCILAQRFNRMRIRRLLSRRRA